MFKKSFIAGLLLLALVAIPLSSLAQTPAVTNGLNWLSSTQTIDGHWPGVATEEFVATTTATEALFLLNSAAPGYGQGVQWLEGHPVSPTDLLARCIHSLARAGRTTATEVAQLLALRNASGGWGGDDGYLFTSLDTALALQALKAANYPDLSLSNTSLAWLTNSQHSDGGWGFTADGGSNVAMTAVVASTLQQFPQTATLATALSKADSYLISHQNLDGGFGVTPGGAPASSIHETALASIALAGSGQGEWGPQQSALTYLTNNQALNGSWNDDPYTTALALTALYLAENKPTPPPPPSTTGSMIGTVIDAATQLPLSGVSAVLVSNPSITASTDSKGLFALSGLPKGAQQIILTAGGYAPLTITVAITADTFINTGKIGLSVTPTTGTIMGVVWDTVDNAPYPGVAIEAIVNNNIMNRYQTRSGADGSFIMTGVTPGTVVVGTPSGPKTGYWNVTMTGVLAPGGILIYNPLMSTTPPPYVNMYLQTAKAIYRKGESVALSATIENIRSSAYEAVLRMSINDPSGTTVFDSSKVVSLDAKGTLTPEENFTLPLDAQGGFYSAKAELTDGNGTIIGSATTSFGLLRSEIAVTPTLPATFVPGVNTITFNLSNSGTVAVASGLLDLTLTAPDGEVLTTTAQDFTLSQGESRNLIFPVTIPVLKFGDYVLSYTQRDETTDGTPATISVTNSVEISPLFDKATYRIGEAANLLLTLKNTGNFALEALTVQVAALDANFSETRSVGFNAAQELTLSYTLPLPVNLSAGDHQTTITLTLPGGVSVTRDASFTIPAAVLALALTENNSAAGSTLSPQISNSGGVDTEVEYILRLYDAGAMQIAESSGTGLVGAGSFLALTLAIPDGAVEGDYNLVVNFKDLSSGKEEIISTPVTISGVKGTLQVQTDKEEYLTTENITALGNVSNSGTALLGGNLHLQVTPAAGIQKQKTWTSQFDFQQGVRSGVDTYGVNDGLIPDDDFSGTAVNGDRWNSSINNGGVLSTNTGEQLQLETSGVINSSSGVISNFQLDGDFDTQVDFEFNSFANIHSHALFLAVFDDGSYFRVGREGNNYQSYTSKILPEVNKTTLSSDTKGKLRLTRTGTVAKTWYWNGSQWINHYTWTVATTPVRIRLYATSYLGTEKLQIKFDNFKVNSGRIKTEDQTVDSVRLLPLNDNFDDGLINKDRWSYYSTTYGNIFEQNGSLYLESLQPNTVSSASVSYRAPQSGDVTVQLDYGLMTWQPQNSHKFGLSFNISDASTYYYLERSFDTRFLGESYLTHYWNSGVGTVVPTTDTSGRLRIGRQGSEAISSYYHNNDWTILKRAYAPDGNAQFSIALWNDPGFPNPVTKVSLNNFQVNNKGKYTAKGTLREKLDIGMLTLTSIDWNADIPLGTSIKLRIRTAATESGLTSAPWSLYITDSGSPVPSQSERWIEIEATLETTDTNLTPLLHDVTVTYGNNPGDILWQTDVPVDLAQGAISEFNNLIGILGASGKYYLQGTLTSSTGQTVASAEYPFYVAQGETLLSINSDRKIYKPGEIVTITGTLQNLSTIDAANLTLTVQAQPTGGTTVPLATEILTLPAGGSRPFTLTTIAGAEGVVTLTALVSQNGTTLAEMADQYEVASPTVTAILSGPELAGSTSFALNLALNNSGKSAATVTVANSFSTTTETLTLPAGESLLRTYPQQISAETLYTFTLSGDLNQTLTQRVAYSAPDVTSVSATIVTDKISYNPQESVVLTSTITSAASLENLSAWIRVSDSQGQDLYSERINLPSLIQGQTYSFNKSWNSGTTPAGIYSVSVQIYNGVGAVLTAANGTLTINAPWNPKSLLRGELSLDQQHILTGEPLAVTYRVTNVGNSDLNLIDLEIRTIGAVDQGVYASITDQTALAIGALSAKSGQIDTQGFSAKDYLVVLLAKIDGVEEALAGTYFRVEGAPSVPALIEPVSGADVISCTPTLKISNAADPNADRLSYEFELYTDGTLSTLVVSGIAEETSSSTLWTVPTPLIENQTYYWRVRAYDGRLFGPWMEVSSFRVNVANDPPSAPQIAAPANDTSVAEFTPTLTVDNAADPDSPLLVYHFAVASDPDFNQVVATESGMAGGETMTIWTLPLPLEENGWYYWRAQADDLLTVGPWSATAKFLVNSTNDPPTTPLIVAPLADSVVAALETDVVVSNSTDPDSPILSYYFEADTAATFDSANLLRSEMVMEGQGSTFWRLSGLLENTGYSLRVKASDGMAESPWSEVVGFFVNAVNEPPTSPVLDNPSDGSGVNLLTPTLSVRNALDPDRDPLTYEFALYTDAALTNLLVRSDNIAPSTEVTEWPIPWALTENQTYYWQARASDGLLISDWMPTASFMINTANDAPAAPQLAAPMDGMKVTSLTPVLTIVNAVDPEGEPLTYDFELYQGGLLIASFSKVTPGAGTTSVALEQSLVDGSAYSWRVRAFDGDLYGPWMTMANFSIALPKAAISVEIEFEPETLNKRDEGEWVQVKIELPHGYQAEKIDLSTIRLVGTIPAELRPVRLQREDHKEKLTVKFKRKQVIAVLPSGKHVPVHVTGMIGSTPFSGVDFIRVNDHQEDKDNDDKDDDHRSEDRDDD